MKKLEKLKKRKKSFSGLFRAGAVTLTAIVSSLIMGCKSAPAAPDIPTPPNGWKQGIVKPEKPEIKGYDNDTHKVSDKTIENMLNSSYIVDVNATYKVRDTGEEKDLGGRGTGFVVKHDKGANGKLYFITCEHVVDTPQIYKVQTWFGEREYADLVSFDGVYIIDDNGKKHEAKIESVNTKDGGTDIAVLTTEGNISMWLKHYKPIEFTKEEIKPGDAAYSVGYSSGRESKLIKYINQGIISNTDSDLFFFESAALNSGFSGGPIFVLKNGKPYIAGVNEFYMIGRHDQFGAVYSKHAKDELEKVLRGEGNVPDYKPKPKIPPEEPEKPETPESETK